MIDVSRKTQLFGNSARCRRPSARLQDSLARLPYGALQLLCRCQGQRSVLRSRPPIETGLRTQTGDGQAPGDALPPDEHCAYGSARERGRRRLLSEGVWRRRSESCGRECVPDCACGPYSSSLIYDFWFPRSRILHLTSVCSCDSDGREGRGYYQGAAKCLGTPIGHSRSHFQLYQSILHNLSWCTCSPDFLRERERLLEYTQQLTHRFKIVIFLHPTSKRLRTVDTLKLWGFFRRQKWHA